jgi:hypothetical protein
MKIELQLDYKTILRNSSRPVHLVAKLTAPAQPLTKRLPPWCSIAPVQWAARRSNTQSEPVAK